MHARSDVAVPPAPGRVLAAEALRPVVAAASASAPVATDVMVVYTPGFVTTYGSEGAALARIQYLVDWTNQAYASSKVYQSINLVHAVEVDYPDNTDDLATLNDLTNPSTSTNPAAKALLRIAGLRARYRADLVALLRPYDPAQNDCGIGWMNGANGTVMQRIYGYSVVNGIGDVAANGASCGDFVMAHELGHNMGDEHDRADASEGPGAYPYSYGYQSTSANGFHTVMAYGIAGQTPVAVFSNPDIAICQNLPCGVADSDSNNAADNTRRMNNTAPFVALRIRLCTQQCQRRWRVGHPVQQSIHGRAG